MTSGKIGDDVIKLVVSMILGPIVFIVLFKLIRAVVADDLGFLLASLVATYGGVSAPWLVVTVWPDPSTVRQGVPSEA